MGDALPSDRISEIRVVYVKLNPVGRILRQRESALEHDSRRGWINRKLPADRNVPDTNRNLGTNLNVTGNDQGIVHLVLRHPHTRHRLKPHDAMGAGLEVQKIDRAGKDPVDVFQMERLTVDRD